MTRRVWVVGGLVAAAAVVAALAAGLIARSDPVAARPQPALSERGEHSELGGSQAFRRHQEDLFAARGEPGEGPTSWAQENFELNGSTSPRVVSRRSP
jgi:hypothetical protein